MNIFVMAVLLQKIKVLNVTNSDTSIKTPNKNSYYIKKEIRLTFLRMWFV
jgi:hypothetical protein